MENEKIYCNFCGESFRSEIEKNKHIPHCSVEKDTIENVEIYFNFEKLENKNKKQIVEEIDQDLDYLRSDESFILNSTEILETKTLKSVYGEMDLYKINTKFKNFYLTRNQLKQLDKALRDTKTFLPKEIIYKGKEKGKEPFETKHIFEF